MPDAEQCPRCGKAMLVPGKIYQRSLFRPKGLKFFSLSFQLPHVSVAGEATACIGCGLVCSQLDAAALRQKLRDLGDEETKKRLGLGGSE